MGLMVNRRKMTMMVLSLVLIFSFGLTAIAVADNDADGSAVKTYLQMNCRQSGDDVTYSNQLKKIMKKYPYQDGVEGNQCVDVTIDGKSHLIYLSKGSYDEINKLSAKAQNRARVREQVDSMGYNFSVQADVESAGVALSGLEGIVTMIVGILAYIIVLGMTLFTTLDVCYITMPVFKNKADEVVQKGGAFTTRTDGRTGEARHRWITEDAQYAVANATIENGKSPLTIYLGKRIWAYIMLAIVLFILLTGNIQLIVNIAIQFISGLIEALEGLAG